MARRIDHTPSLFPDGDDEPARRGDDGAGIARSSATSRASMVRPATHDATILDLGARLPPRLWMGTSSWSFPGWNGLVYEGGVSESVLAHRGLEAYARHPLFRSVGVDKTYYRPAPRAEFERLAAQVPDGFRFLVKMWRGVVEPPHGVVQPPHGAVAPPPGGSDPRAVADTFLDARVAEVECVRPAVEGLGAKAGPLLFQFPPMRLRSEREERGFIARLGGFLRQLPRGPLFAVEVRNRTLVGPELGETLAACGAVPCLTVHPTMPGLEVQSRELALDPSQPLVMRWMLRANHQYGEAKDLYAPFDRLVEPDDASRDALARLAQAALGAGLGVWIIVNNKAEGSSPRSVERLAERLAGA